MCAKFGLHLNISFEYNPTSGVAGLLGVEDITPLDGVPQRNVRSSDISGYTAGSSNTASSVSPKKVKPPPKGIRVSQATHLSGSSASSFEAIRQQPQKPLPKERMIYLKRKYANHELVYNILDCLDRIIADVPSEQAQKVPETKPSQVKRDATAVVATNQKKTKLANIPELCRPEKITFVKGSKNSLKYYPAKAMALKENDEYLVEFYNGILRTVQKEHIFENFQDPDFEKKAMYMKATRKRVEPDPALIVDLFIEDDDWYCRLITDHVDLDRVHISSLFLTQEMITGVTRSKVEVHSQSSDAKQSFDYTAATPSKSSVPSSSSEGSEFRDESKQLIPGCDPEQTFFLPFTDDKLKGKKITASAKNEEILGPLNEGNWFKGFAFILTCSKYCVSVSRQDILGSDDENFVFTKIPFVYDHLQAQIRMAGGLVFDSYSDVPTRLHKNLFLIAPKPCATARYIECMTFNVKLICHEWIVRCSQSRSVVPFQELPLGWSIERKCYVNSFDRKNATPFLNVTVTITRSPQNNFFKFWSRLMKYCGADVKPSRRSIKAPDTIVIENGGRPPITVSTMWVLQSILHGEMRNMDADIEYDTDLD